MRTVQITKRTARNVCFTLTTESGRVEKNVLLHAKFDAWIAASTSITVKEA